MTEITNIPEAGGIADIVVGIDDSPSSHAALDWAAKAARSSGDRLRAVHVLTSAITSPLVCTNGFPAMAYVAEARLSDRNDPAKDPGPFRAVAVPYKAPK